MRITTDSEMERQDDMDVDEAMADNIDRELFKLVRDCWMSAFKLNVALSS